MHFAVVSDFFNCFLFILFTLLKSFFCYKTATKRRTRSIRKQEKHILRILYINTQYALIEYKTETDEKWPIMLRLVTNL